jgi:hypothetical protein
MTDANWRYWIGVATYGIYLMDRCGYQATAWALAFEVLSMEANA